MKLSIIIPAYNEEKTIASVIEAVKAVALPAGIEKEILVVNDGSSDNTKNILDALKNDSTLRIFHQTPNQGKTAALRKGFAEATGDILLIQDADLEYDPSQYPVLLAEMLSGKSQVVYGSRFTGRIANMELINRASNVFSNWTFNLLYGTHLTDINTCFKVFRASYLKEMNIASNHFAFETEVTAKLVKKGISISEVPINYEARTVVEGKKINWLSALDMYWAIIKFRFVD